MDFSAANTELWNTIIQAGMIAGILLIANVLRRKIGLVRKSLMPTSVLGGFLLLLIRVSRLVPVSIPFLEMVTYHGIALGFIALSLRTLSRKDPASMDGPKSGALIVSCYVIQGITGLVITLALSYTLMPDLFKAAGVLLPMGYGQGPGQANNIGTVYENLGFAGGRSFALSIAAAGFLSACVAGIIYLNILNRGGMAPKNRTGEIAGSVTVDTFQDQGEIPVSESIDKLSIQAALVLLTYLAAYLVTRFLNFSAGFLGEGAAKMTGSLLWGFNFLVGAILAVILRNIFGGLRRSGLMTRQYTNNYLLSRISGLAFDLMIICGIAAIEISDLRGLWLPFILLSLAGAVVTLFYLRWICKKIYPAYYLEGLLSMYGMMTGTISSGIILLRELDPDYRTPAADNLVAGSAFAVPFGIPILALIGIAPKSPAMTFFVLAGLGIYMVFLLVFLVKRGKPESSVIP
ncbi:MAG: sodium:glutamate symporter [Treponema sp.]|jgi:ESS family glutamate:Na+ symporter|nr:sodium:glutamate symporter [Treponema sp.]